MIALHSTKSIKPISAGILHTGDGSAFVTVAQPAGLPSGTRWTVDGDTLPGAHSFATRIRPDEARVDVSALFSQAEVHLVSGTTGADVCFPFSVGLMALRDSPSDTVVAVLPEKGGQATTWPALPAGNLVLTPSIAIENAYIASTSSGIHISGQLLLGSKLQSSSTIDLQLQPATQSTPTTLVAGNVKFTEASSSGSFTVDITGFKCTVAQSTNNCSFSASLELPPGIVTSPTAAAGTQATIAIVLGDDGVFRLTNPNTSVYWGAPPRSASISLSSLIADTTTGKLSVSGALVTKGNTFSITNLSFRQADPPATGYIPTGTIAFDEANPLSLGSAIAIKHLSGNIAFEGGANSTATLTANAVISISPEIGSSVQLEIENLSLTVQGDAFGAIQAGNISTWQPDFSHAKIVPDVLNSTLFGHTLDVCPENVANTASDPDAPRTMQFCIGVHLSPGAARNPDDLAYGAISFQQWDVKSKSLQLRSLSITVPTMKPATIGFGGARAEIKALSMNLGSPGTGGYDGFDTDIDANILSTMNCTGISAAGELSVTGIGFGSKLQEVSVTPRLGFGSNCTAFVLRGALPVEFTPQSSMLLTSLIFVHTTTQIIPKAVQAPPAYAVATPSPIAAPAPAAAAAPASIVKALDYFKASGSFTSGNVTVFFNDIGFRTFIPTANPAGSKPTDWYCDRKNHQEYEIPGTNTCAIVNVNLPMTLAATGAQNASAIEKIIQSAASAFLGYAVGRK